MADKFVLECNNLETLVNTWETLTGANVDWTYDPELFAALRKDRFRRIRWFFYTNNAEGIAVRLYDQEFRNAHEHLMDFGSKPGWVIVRAEKLDDNTKRRMEEDLALIPASQHGLVFGGDERRLTFFAKRNVDGGGPRLLPPGGAVATESEVIALLLQFRQVILYGPPGTGKTRLAQRTAFALLGKNSPIEPRPPAADEFWPSDKEVYSRLDVQESLGCYKLVVFHPAYEYEQFVGGIVPTPDGPNAAPQPANSNNVGGVRFSVEPGTFMRLCAAAKNLEEGQKAVLIIDEINRGMLPKLLGELVYALEYRGRKVQLPFTTRAGQSELTIPKNLYIIATMNSSDRSIGHIDVAIRRRFGLHLVEPSVDVVKAVWRKLGRPETGEGLARVMAKLNGAFEDHELGVGHSYFIPTSEGDLRGSAGHLRLVLRHGPFHRCPPERPHWCGHCGCRGD